MAQKVLAESLWESTDGQTVTPGITALEYAHRRSKLANRLPKDAVAVLAAAEVKYRAPGIFYEYHQDPDFFYLTGEISHGSGRPRTSSLRECFVGFTEPGALAIIGKSRIPAR
jgi:Aminopeptidase P, N-terminal domain